MKQANKNKLNMWWVPTTSKIETRFSNIQILKHYLLHDAYYIEIGFSWMIELPDP